MKSDNTLVLYSAIGVLLLVSGLLGGVVVGNLGHGPVVGERGLSLSQPASSPPAIRLSPELSQFMAGWMCPCGSCEDLLVECPCDMPNGAHEVRTYVRQLNADGVTLDDIRNRVVDRYGSTVVGAM